MANDAVVMEEGLGEDEDLIKNQTKELMSNTCWLSYCFFCGTGCSNCCDPLFLGTFKFLCCEGLCSTAPGYGEDGCCNTLSKCCCLVNVGSFPPGGGGNDGVPCFACCNIRCGGEGGQEDGASKYEQLVRDTFLCSYCLCCGLGCSSPSSDPLFLGTLKCCCLKTSFATSPACDEATGCCYIQSKCCCCIQALTLPPGGGKSDGIPALACCGVTIWSGEKGDADSDEEARS
ncbi:unnamed protein product [Polarella glacialis]|uniref:Uncharacterized protein n=1 Tax=Polarella glacialis TaxID=89957 RepID=A0A813L655_POLGL|nr:unnamed protein product [Polarella glacialis]